MIEKSQVKLQKDFENWWQEQCEILEQKQKKNSDYDRTVVESVSTVTSSIQSANSLLSNSRMNSSVNSSLNQSYQSDRYAANDVFENPRRLPSIEQSDG